MEIKKQFLQTQLKSVAQKLRDAGFEEIETNDKLFFTFLNIGEVPPLTDSEKKMLIGTDIISV